MWVKAASNMSTIGYLGAIYIETTWCALSALTSLPIVEPDCFKARHIGNPFEVKCENPCYLLTKNGCLYWLSDQWSKPLCVTEIHMSSCNKESKYQLYWLANPGCKAILIIGLEAILVSFVRNKTALWNGVIVVFYCVHTFLSPWPDRQIVIVIIYGKISSLA